MKNKSQKFSAKIYKEGINPYIDVPKEVSDFFGKRGNIPVKGTINNYPIRATLVPKGGGRHHLYINLEMRKGANLGAGDRVNLALEINTEPRAIPMPEELVKAFQKSKKAKTAWEIMTPSRRKDILNYLNYLKKPESLKRNIEKVMKFLLKQK